MNKKKYFLRIIIGILFVFTSSARFLNGVNIQTFDEDFFKQEMIGSQDITDVILENPNAVKRHLQGLKFGIFKNSSDPTQRAIILWAARHNTIQAVKAIVTIAEKEDGLQEHFSLSINYQDPHTGNTPLHEAVLKGDADIIQLLINKGANQLTPNNQGNTSLHEAVIADNLEVAKLLINSIQKNFWINLVSIENKQAKKALDLAKQDSDLEEYLNDIVNQKEIDEKKEEIEENQGEEEEVKNKKDKNDIQDNQLEGRLEKLSESLSKHKSKLDALKNSLGQLKKNLDEKSGPLAMDSSEELAKQEADKKNKKEQEKLKAGVKFNQIPTTKLLKVPRKVGGAVGRRLPTKNLKNKLQKLKLESEKLQAEIEGKDEKTNLERQKTIENLTKFKADLKLLKSQNKPLSKVRLQALLQQNNLAKYFTNLNLMFDKSVTVGEFIKVIDKEIVDLSMQIGLE